jgi:hypothetical protein
VTEIAFVALDNITSDLSLYLLANIVVRTYVLDIAVRPLRRTPLELHCSHALRSKPHFPIECQHRSVMAFNQWIVEFLSHRPAKKVGVTNGIEDENIPGLKHLPHQ